MKFFIVLALVAVAAADVSHLRTPEADSVIIEQDADVFPDQFRYKFETSNGISGQETGALKNVGREDEAISVQGSNSYTAPDGQQIQITYVADEFGFRAVGSHLPTPPPTQPIPVYIQRALEYIAANPPQPEVVKRV